MPLYKLLYHIQYRNINVTKSESIITALQLEIKDFKKQEEASGECECLCKFLFFSQVLTNMSVHADCLIHSLLFTSPKALGVGYSSQKIFYLIFRQPKTGQIGLCDTKGEFPGVSTKTDMRYNRQVKKGYQEKKREMQSISIAGPL